jgi:hypothetical protein
VTVIVGEEEWTPHCLREEIVLLKQGLPDVEEIRTFLGQIRESDPALAKACETDPDLLERLAVAGRGLDLVDLERAIRILRLTDMPAPTILSPWKKRRILQQTGIMNDLDNWL